MAEWELIYWHILPGRGDFVRLIFEEAGVDYDDVCRRTEDYAPALHYLNRGQTTDEPSLFPPVVKKGDFVLNQTTAILMHLGKEFGLYPTGGAQQEALALQWALTAADYIGEGHDCFHPLDKSGSYDSQKEEAKPYIEKFKKERMPKFLDMFEKTLLLNNGGEQFFIGDTLTYLDITIFHVLRATESQFPEDYKTLPIPTLRSFAERMKKRPRIKAYLESDRCLPFCGNSMM